MATRTSKSKGAGKKSAEKKPRGEGRKRIYTDEERAEALAVLDAVGGNVERAARMAGVPASTLDEWAKGRVKPEVLERKEEIKATLYDRLESLAEDIVGMMVRRVREDAENHDPKARVPFNTAAVAVGIVVDKMKVLKEMPGAAAAGAGPASASDMTPEARRAESARLLALGRERLQLVRPEAKDERTA